MNSKSNKRMVWAMGCLLGTGLPALAQFGTLAERSSSCMGDLNSDGTVNRADVTILTSSYGQCIECDEDLDSDGIVGDRDLAVLVRHFGPCRESTRTVQCAGREGRRAFHETEESDNSIVEPGATCSGDLDGSGEVDSADLAIVLGGYGRCSRCEEDITGDTFVDSRDLAMVLGAWGSCAAERPEDPTSFTTDRSVALAVVSAVIGYESDGAAALSPHKGVRFIASNAEELGEEPDPAEPQSRKGVRFIAGTGEELTDESLSVPVPVCTGDLNHDGDVDADDLALMLGSGVRRCRGCSQDFNGDTHINGADFAILLGAWGSCDIE